MPKMVSSTRSPHGGAATIRPPAVAGTWYSGRAEQLVADVERHLGAADKAAQRTTHALEGTLLAIVAPHAGLKYSGPVAAFAYRLLRGRSFDVVVLVGPSHFVDFEGVAVWDTGGFATPLGVAPIDSSCAADITRALPGALLSTGPDGTHGAHRREHCLEMQLPFLQHVAPTMKIVPILMGRQTAATARALGDAMASALRGRQALLIASTDLSHYHDAQSAAQLDGVVVDCLAAFDADRLQSALDIRPDHACGGGPTVSVLHAARQLGARDGQVLRYADSGDVSGDKSAVVGYVAAAFGVFKAANAH